MKYIKARKDNDDFIRLCTDLDSSLNNETYGDATAATYNMANKLNDIEAVIIAYAG